MGAVRLVSWAECRQRWRSWAAVALLIAVVGGVVIGLAAAGYRTVSAYPRFVAATDGMDAEVYDSRGFSPAVAAVSRLPQVAAAAPVTFLPAVLRAGARQIPDSTVVGSTGTAFGRSFNRAKILAGRMPGQGRPGEAMVAFGAVPGLGLGSVLHLAFYGPGQAGALFAGLGRLPPAPDGPVATVKVVGIEASVGDFGPAAASPTVVYLSPALVQRIRHSALAGDIEEVRLRHGAASIPAFQAAIGRFGGGGSGLQMQNMDGEGQLVQRSIHLQAVGWWLLAAAAGLAAIAVVGQMLARQAAADAADYPVLRALGMSSGRLFILGMTRVSAMAVAGAAASAAVAFGLSPLAPLGEAAIAEPSPGLRWDTPVLLWGMLAVLVVVVAAAAVPVAAQARRRGVPGIRAEEGGAARPSRAVTWLAQVGAPASVLVGARGALERGRGREAVPTASVFLCTVLGTAALAGGIVFGASLTHLLSTPRLYGVSYDFEISSDQLNVTPVLHTLLRDRSVIAITGGVEGPLRIGGLTVYTMAGGSYKGPVLLTVTAGRYPSRPGQIALGAATLRQLGTHIGGRVPVTVGQRTFPFTVVGTAVFPQFGSTGGLGTGAVMTLAGYRAAACPADLRAPECPIAPDGILVRLASGPGHAAALSQMQRRYAASFSAPFQPASLVNFGQVVNLPLILGLAVAVFGAATLLHFLLVSVARRRRQLGTLRALGFLRRQVAAAVTWQAETVAAVALVLGVPLGLAAGRLAWNLAASDFGVPSVVIAPWFTLAAASAAALAAAAVIAAGPALLATRLHPAALLRSE
jgi:FtsX-like permease family